ncbi:MAG: hypothetical protein WBC19_09660 [Pyrinomonadaceae bacterium]|nr:hypothetical protein [Chloracidobacterium sp.]MBP7416749.1 hypothetical protein [Pyrinomonadaceae bacterium]
MRSFQPVRRTFFLAVFAIALGLGMSVVSVAQPGTAAKNPLVGRWKSDIAVIEIRANGTVKINDDEFVYKVKNSVITVASDEGVMTFPYELDGDTLVVQVDGSEVVYKRLKGNETGGTGGVTFGTSNGTGSEGSVIPAFVGQWCYQANLNSTNSYHSRRCFTLYANGTYEYSSDYSQAGGEGGSSSQSSDSGRWTATRNTITAYSRTNGKVVYPIELRNHPKTGDPMIVIDGDAYVTQTQKPAW